MDVISGCINEEPFVQLENDSTQMNVQRTRTHKSRMVSIVEDLMFLTIRQFGQNIRQNRRVIRRHLIVIGLGSQLQPVIISL